jgi:hypothetical protein
MPTNLSKQHRGSSKSKAQKGRNLPQVRGLKKESCRHQKLRLTKW